MNDYSRYIQHEIKAVENADKARWLENYIKHDLKSLGVGIPEIREIVKNAEKKFNITKQAFSDQKKMLDDLMRQTYTEYKISAVLFIQLYWNKADANEVLKLISEWFNKGWITDWNVCDWLCVRVLSPLVDNHPNQTLSELAKWNKDKDLWKARAPLVAFAQCKTIAEHKETIFDFSVTLIKRDERFCKTAVGWVMREFSKVDKKFVTDFLENHKGWTTQEVIRNATKYLSQKEALP